MTTAIVVLQTILIIVNSVSATLMWRSSKLALLGATAAADIAKTLLVIHDRHVELTGFTHGAVRSLDDKNVELSEYVHQSVRNLEVALQTIAAGVEANRGAIATNRGAIDINKAALDKLTGQVLGGDKL